MGKRRDGKEGREALRGTASPASLPKSRPGDGGDIPLRGMASRQKGVIARIEANGELGRRIRDMGLVPGALVEVQGRAPLNDPVAVRICDFTLTLRNNEADLIYITVEDE